jgi:1-deoxy-D-xylulose-5-phosphate reductoisomerase
MEIASLDDIDLVVSSISGVIGLLPTVAAINAGKNIAIANKEILVSAGEYVMNLAKAKNIKIIPIDSEHSGLFQCIENRDKSSIRRLILTASGGPFHGYSRDQLEKVSINQALTHPTWPMGLKNTIDSSTLMNKGLEVIEAFWLFGIDLDKIDVVVHPQSIIHSMVEFIDGSVLAQASVPDMKIPIQYALSYPERLKSNFGYLDFSKKFSLQFFPPDKKTFICLSLAYEALRVGKSFPCYMNAANEILVERFLNKEISWIEIMDKLEKLMSSHTVKNMLNLDSILSIDEEAREKALLI